LGCLDFSNNMQNGQSAQIDRTIWLERVSRPSGRRGKPSLPTACRGLGHCQAKAWVAEQRTTAGCCERPQRYWASQALPDKYALAIDIWDTVGDMAKLIIMH